MENVHEMPMQSENISFKMFIIDSEDKSYCAQEHVHSFVEIFALFEGCIEFCIDNKNVLLSAGKFMLVNSNEIHSVNLSAFSRAAVLQISPLRFGKCNTGGEIISFSHDRSIYDSEVMRLISDMSESYNKKETGHELMVQSLFYRLIYLLVSKYSRTQDERASRMSGRMSEIIDYMKANCTCEITLEGLSGIFGYSVTYLSKMFRKYAQVNFKTYLNNLRLEHAYGELMNTDLSVWAIASRSGFANSKAFTKVFRECYGVPPGRYRKGR